MKIRNSSRQNAEKSHPDVEKKVQKEYITKEFSAINTRNRRYKAFKE